MHITTGTRIGAYEVLDSLGAGGMGHVYRATDPRLGREIAIKALPAEMAKDPDAMARFEREARFLASLSHPNIAAIYEIEEHEGERFLVLELVRGETLDAIVARGPLPLATVVRLAIEIASGLEAAHEAGIIHRDLKPSNVKITPDGHVKLLDFGIAKSLAPDAGAQSRAETVQGLTHTGSVVGTPAYMSPEQIRGGEVDRRTDIWAFGCLLYEMLSGRHAFNGNSYLELADAIRHAEPDWNALPRHTPERIRRLLARCLRKDQHERIHDIGDVRLELQEGEPASVDGRGKRFPLGAFAIAIAVVAAALIVWSVRNRPASRALVTGAPKLTQITSAEGVEEFPAWSPDGKSIAYAGEVHGTRKIFVRRVGANEDTQVTAGDFDDLQPAWSADARRILFVRGREAKRRVEPGDVFDSYEASSGDLWSVDLQTHRETKLAQGAFSPAVSPDGKSIAVDASWAGPRRIWIVDERGYNPLQATTEASEAVTHIAPRWSPDGKRIVYQRIERTKFDIASVDLATRQSTMITDDSYQDVFPVWSRDGGSVFFSSYRSGGMNIWRVALGANGKPAGPPQQVTNGAGQDVQVATSPNGKSLVYATLRQNADVWRLPVTPEGAVRGEPEEVIVTTREDSRGAWSPDTSEIAFNSDRAGDTNIWIYSIAGHSARQVTSGAGGDFQPAWSPDARHLVFFSARAGNADIWAADRATGKLTQLTRGRSLDINPYYSPDGTRIVYQSDASGRLELWTMAADGTQQRQLTDTGVGGHFERWQRDGFVYFYRRSGDARALAKVPGTGGAPQDVSPNVGAHLSFSPDGSRYIDVTAHKVLWLYGIDGSKQQLFTFADPEVRIDYPVWSPDGQWLLFDRFKPQGGDIWIADSIDWQ